MQEVAVSDRRTDCPKRRSVAGSALRTMRGHNRSRRERPADSDAADAPVKDGIRKDTTYYLYSPADRRLFRPSKYKISLDSSLPDEAGGTERRNGDGAAGGVYSISARSGTSSALQMMQSVLTVGFERPVSIRLRFERSMSQR